MASNSLSWSDTLYLVNRTETADTDGYTTYTESTREIFCNFVEGVSRGEFYEAYKSGIQLSAQCDINHFDYEGEKLARHNGITYNVIRVYPSGYDTLRLVLEEKMR